MATKKKSRTGGGKPALKGKMAKQGRYVCVVHMSKPAQKVMDRKRGKTSRSEFIREALASKHGKVFLE